MSIEKTLFDKFQEYESNYSVLEQLPIVISLRKENMMLQTKVDLLLNLLANNSTINNKQNIVKTEEPQIDVDKNVITKQNIKLNSDSITTIRERYNLFNKNNKITYEIIEENSNNDDNAEKLKSIKKRPLTNEEYPNFEETEAVKKNPKLKKLKKNRLKNT